MIAMECVKRNTDVGVPSCIQILLSIEEPVGTWLLLNQVRRARTFYSFSCQQCLKSNKTNFSQSGCLLDHFCKPMKHSNPACHSRIRFFLWSNSFWMELGAWNYWHKKQIIPVHVDFPNPYQQVGSYMNSNFDTAIVYKCKQQISI